MVKGIDTGSLIVMVITFLLFAGSICVKGVTHDILLEAGVFLVSVKLIIMAQRNTAANETLKRRLDELKEMLLRLDNDAHHT